MSNRRTKIRASDVERIVKGVLAAGLPVARIDFRADNVAIFTNAPATHQRHEEDLDQELADFEARHGQG
jgi:hypothetical protein